MKKKIFTLLALFAFAFAVNAQVGVGIATPDGSAMLDVTSTTKGFLAPRMTETQRNAISSPATGLLVYQTDGTTGFYYYDGSSWTQVGGSASSGPTLAFTNASGPMAVFPPLNTEVTVASVTQSVTVGNNLKIDGSLNINPVTSASWSFTYEIRLYRDATLIMTQTYTRSGSAAGTQTMPSDFTYVDTAPATSAATTYSMRCIMTSATNITSVSTGNVINLNIITFE
jgi:hypothetical protein